PGTGHAATGPLLARVADTAHLIAMSVWLGGLALLFACVLPLRGSGAASPPVSEVAGLLPRFSRTAMAAVAVLVVTGAYQALAEVGTLGELAGGQYGRLLAFKLAAFGLLLWLGAASRGAVMRRYVLPVVHAAEVEAGRPHRPVRTAKRSRRTEQARDRVVLTQLRKSVGIEALIAVGVLAITAGLVATPPGGEHGHGASAGGAGPVRKTLALPDGGEVLVWIDPARVGPNQFVVNVRNRDDTSRDVDEVRAELSSRASGVGSLPVPLRRVAPGQFVADNTLLPASGRWRLDVTARMSAFDQETVSTRLLVP
ncbi:MAG: copper resistance D family protein, partial [Streptomycetales bacterium]